MKCPNNCDTTGKPFNFYASTACTDTEIAIYVRDDGELSNSWTDGTIGVSDEIRDQYEGHDCMPHCVVCGDEVIHHA